MPWSVHPLKSLTQCPGRTSQRRIEFDGARPRLCSQCSCVPTYALNTCTSNMGRAGQGTTWGFNLRL